MQVSSLEYITSLTIKRLLVDRKRVSESANEIVERNRRTIVKQIRYLQKCHVHLQKILALLVERQPELVTDKILRLLLSGQYHVKRLNLKGCSSLTLEGFSSAIHNQGHIRHLDISGCQNLMEISLGDVLALHLPCLESLVIESCDNLCDNTVRVIVAKCLHIRHLSLACNPGLTDEIFNFESFVHSCRDGERFFSSLSRIDLSGCQGISSKSVRNLFSLCGSTLESVDISWTRVDCTALVYLCGFSLSSAVYIATHANEKKLPFSVAELEASQKFEFQIMKEMNQGNFTSGISQESSDMVAESKNNLSGLYQSFPTFNVGLKDKIDEDTMKCSFPESICHEIDHFEQNPPTNKSVSAGSKQEYNSASFSGIHLHDSASSNYMFSKSHIPRDLTKITKTCCYVCNFEGRAGLRQGHSYSCISDFIMEEKSEAASKVLFPHKFTHYNDQFNHKAGILASSNCLKSQFTIEVFGIGSYCDDSKVYPIRGRINNYFQQVSDPSGLYTGGKQKEQVNACSEVDSEILHPVEEGKSSNCEDSTSNDLESCFARNVGVVPKQLSSHYTNVSLIADVDTSYHVSTCGESFVPNEMHQEAENELQSRSIALELNNEQSNFTIETAKDIENSATGRNSSNDVYRFGLGKSENDANFSADVEYYKPRQMIVSHITELDISQISFYDSDVGKDCIKMFVNSNHLLTSLSISWSGLTDTILEEIAINEPRLSRLGLVECECLSNSGIIAVGKHCKKLQVLDLQGVPFIGDRGLFDVLSSGLLEELSLAECAVSDVTLNNIIKFCSSTISRLDLSWCENITDDSLCDLVSSCPNLEYLNVRQCEISTKTIEALPCISEKLTYLGLCSIKDLTDSQAILMVRFLQSLTFIDLSWNCMITDDTISTLLSSCPMLHEAVLAGLKLITSKPFLPIISEQSQWHSCINSIKSRARRRNYGHSIIATTFDEALDSMFYLPYRSLHYAPNLQKLDLSFSDKVNDNHLAEIVAVCRGSLAIDDYYAMPIKPKWDF